MKSLDELLAASAALHSHVCPRQVLGVRMGMLAGELLAMELPQTGKRLLSIVETDGCFSDGVAVATNCWVGRRTMRVEDYGKVAAAFVDTKCGAALRIFPHPEARLRAHDYAPDAANRWQAMLVGYQRIPAAELLVVQSIELKTSVRDLISYAGRRVVCDMCGEEIINEREVLHDGSPICRACDGQSYYRT